MRIAVSAAGPMLEAQVDPRFGRCAYFVLVDPATFTFEVIENANAGSAQGAGIATAQSIAGKGAQVVLTGNCGPNAWQVLESAHMKVVTGVTGTVRDAVKAYVGGELRPGSQPNVASHHGMSDSPKRGMGSGMQEASFGTRLDYAPYVIGDEEQAKVHRGRWWTISKVAERATGKITKVFTLMAQNLAAFLAKNR